jgi:hypothetical protein
MNPLHRSSPIPAIGLLFSGIFIACAGACNRAPHDAPPQSAASPAPVAHDESAMIGATDTKLRRLADDDVTPDLTQKSVAILKDNADAPLGTEVRFELDGKLYLARIEQHWDQPRGAHRGVTLYAEDRQATP